MSRPRWARTTSARRSTATWASTSTRGVEPWRIFAQYMGREDGPTRGRDGNVHMADAKLGMIAMVSHLPAMLPVAVGCALAFRIREERRVAVGWFGEGSAARGDAHEAMNLAGVRRLPVVFVCDNNQLAYSTPTPPRLRRRAPRRSCRGLRLRRRRRRRHRRARRLPRGEGGDREGARGRRADAARAEDAPDGGPRRPRRRVLRPEGALRGVGEAGSDRALPRLAARERRAHARGGGRDRRARQEDPERRARPGPRTRRSPIRRRSSRASTRPRKTSTRRTTSKGKHGREDLPPGDQRRAPAGDAARRARLRDRRGRRRLRRRLQGDARLPGGVRALADASTRRSPRRRSSARAAAPR